MSPVNCLNMDDVQELQISLDEYEKQLFVVEQALESSSGGENAELIELRKNLEEAISLIRESLPGNSQSPPPASELKPLVSNTSTDKAFGQVSLATSLGKDQGLDDEFARFQTELAGFCTPTVESVPQIVNPAHDDPHLNTDEALQEMISALEGSKCQAPFSQEWGELSYQNALVLSVNVSDCDTNEISFDNLKASVMFCNPICDAMKPCPYFLDGCCRFPDRDCRYSHGNVVNVCDLREYVEPDYSMLQRDSRCLAKYSDGLWYFAIIEDCLENHKFVVKYERYGDIKTVDVEDIFPCAENAHDDSSEDGSIDDKHLSLLASESSSDDETYSAVEVWTMPTTKALGEWEKHTRGIGSKLMAKMGYVLGKGLGKTESGRTEPLPIVVLPAGKSLDKCMELRELAESGGGERLAKKKRRNAKKEEGRIVAGYKWQASKKNVFDFINSKISCRKGGNTSMSHGTSLGSPGASLKTSSVKSLNVKELQVNQNMKQATRELARLRESLARNKNRDKVMEAKIAQSIASQQQIIQQLHAEDQAIQKEQQARKSHQKLAVF